MTAGPNSGSSVGELLLLDSQELLLNVNLPFGAMEESICIASCSDARGNRFS